MSDQMETANKETFETQESCTLGGKESVTTSTEPQNCSVPEIITTSEDDETTPIPSDKNEFQNAKFFF